MHFIVAAQLPPEGSFLLYLLAPMLAAHGQEKCPRELGRWLNKSDIQIQAGYSTNTPFVSVTKNGYGWGAGYDTETGNFGVGSSNGGFTVLHYPSINYNAPDQNAIRSINEARAIYGQEWRNGGYSGADKSSWIDMAVSTFGKLEHAWDAGAGRSVIPDLVSVDLTVCPIMVRGLSTTFTLNLITRGPDKGFWCTTTQYERGGLEVDFGANINAAYYNGNPMNIRAKSLCGPTRNISGGLFWGGNITTSYDSWGSVFQKPTWYGGGTGLGATAGVSYGWGNTTEGWWWDKWDN